MRTPALREQTQTVYCEGSVKPLTTPWVNTHRTIHSCTVTHLHVHMNTHTQMYPLTHTSDMQTHQLGPGPWLEEV